jgi:aspartyl-tRNA(Asn)/glutamyl-tRNA(Gln) amidotransferase subunit A
VEALLARIARIDGQLGAFVHLDAAAARRAAAASDVRWRTGHPAGPLDGVPVSLKDLLAVAGAPTRRGSRTSSQEPSDTDAPAAARLREAGAVILGKTATSEFGLGGQALGASGAPTRNPWDPTRTPGGSSSGAVASVAAGLSPLAVGTDGGGSIRVPSAYSGVVGFKPSFGIVAHAPAVLIGVPAHVGPIARSVADGALLFSVLTGSDARDPFHVGLRQPQDWLDQRDGSLEGLVIAATTAPDRDGPRRLDAAVAAGFTQSIAHLRSLGATVVEVALDLPPSALILRTLAAGRAAMTVRSIAPERRSEIGSGVQELARIGDELTAVEYLQAEADRVDLAEAVSLLYRPYDLLLTPTAATVAPILVEPQAPQVPGWSQPGFAGVFSLTRQPAISVPVSVSPEGLPVGVQFIGRYGDDATVLRVAWHFERSRGPLAQPTLDWIRD